MNASLTINDLFLFQKLKRAKTNYGTSFHGGFNLPKKGAYAIDLAARKLQEAAESLSVSTKILTLFYIKARKMIETWYKGMFWQKLNIFAHYLCILS